MTEVEAQSARRIHTLETDVCRNAGCLTVLKDREVVRDTRMEAHGQIVRWEVERVAKREIK